jgi:hypothetical protein
MLPVRIIVVANEDVEANPREVEREDDYATNSLKFVLTL